jgi:ketosteroid isomerase-like protein
VSEPANVQLVKDLYQAMAQPTADAVLALLCEDVQFVVPGPPSVGAAGTWRGHAGVQERLDPLRSGQENQAVEFLEFVAQDDKVVVMLHVKARVHATGKVFESDIVHLFTIKDGKIARLVDFFDTFALVDAHRVND